MNIRRPVTNSTRSGSRPSLSISLRRLIRMLRILSTAAASTLLLASAGAVSAQEAPGPAPAAAPAGEWSFALGAATDNRSKEASKSDGDPYVWGQTEWASASGLFYGGAGFETIKSSTGSEL